jgi:integrase/recombinase XerD
VLRDLVEEYLETSEPRLSSATLAQYRFSLAVFLAWADAEHLTDPAEVTPRALARFSTRLQKEPGPRGKLLSAETGFTYARAVNLFLKWAHGRGHVVELKAEGPKLRRQIIVTLTREEIDQLERAASSARDRLLVRVLADTGCRLSELIGLRIGDVVREGGRCYLRFSGKTGGRVVGIEASLHRRLRTYVEGGRHGDPNDEQGPVFMSLRRRPGGDYEPLTKRGVQQLIHNLGRDAGIKKRIYPHMLRHSYATSFLAGGGDSVVLAKILGHSSLTMIQSRYAHLVVTDVHDAMLRHLKGAK